MVRRIQAIVGTTVDGVWGPKTTAAVKAWQKAHQLTADGIVGPLTLAKMGISDSNTGQQNGGTDSIKIIKATINKHITTLPNRTLKYIAVHYTAGSTSKGGTALSTRKVFLNREASADFVVDDEQIVQINPDIRNNYCWAVGDKKKTQAGGGKLYGIATNRNTISIEICSNLTKGTSDEQPNHEGWYFTDKALDNARKLVRYLMKAYGIPKENVVRHYDISGKMCPGVPGWNNGPLYTTSGIPTSQTSNSMKWQAFFAAI
jgi:N-acetylmuramoyl-L-alanine amidase CwlA